MGKSIISCACPLCGTRFSISGDSEGCEATCPGCGGTLDLTKLNPGSTDPAPVPATAASSDELIAENPAGWTKYCCPHCGCCFAVDDNSDAYLVPCPQCGSTIDLTELEPETPQKATYNGLTIEETSMTVRREAVDPVGKVLDSAIVSASIAASKAAATGLRTFRRFQSAVANLMASPPPSNPGDKVDCIQLNQVPNRRAIPSPPNPPGKPEQTPCDAVAQEESRDGRSSSNPSDGNGLDGWRTELHEGRYLYAVALSLQNAEKGSLAECLQMVRQAAAKGNRNAMMAMAGCYLQGIGLRSDPLSSRFWQARAKASSAEMAEVLRILNLETAI